MKRKFTKYPSNKVYASTTDKYNVELTGAQICTLEDILVEFIQSNNMREESRLVKDARLILGQLRDEYDEYIYPHDDEDDEEYDEEDVDEYDDDDEDYFGEASRNKYGSEIDKTYHGQVITKRLDRADEKYPSIGLRVVQRTLGIPPSITVRALEGMCYNNEACEINDSEYFVGSYAEYQRKRR